MKDKKIDIEIIKKFIEINNVENKINNAKLKNKFFKSPSTKKNINNLKIILKKYVDSQNVEKIIMEYKEYLVSHGTKGALRENYLTIL